MGLAVRGIAIDTHAVHMFAGVRDEDSLAETAAVQDTPTRGYRMIRLQTRLHRHLRRHRPHAHPLR